MEIITKSARETKDSGRKIAADLKKERSVKSSADEAVILALVGDLGSGKTTLIQGLAEGLGVGSRIVSPTFIIMRNYEIPSSGVYTPPFTSFYHVDLYRLEKGVEEEIKNLGLTDIWKDPVNVIAIEWAEKIKQVLPKSTRWLEIDYIKDDERRIKLVNF